MVIDSLKESHEGSEAREEAYKKEKEDLFGGVQNESSLKIK